jgi:hypothetical protein
MRSSRVAYIAFVLASLALFASVYFYAHIQELREQRVTDQTRTFQLICERQELTVRRLIDTKQKQIAANKILHELIVGITERPDPDPEDGHTRMLLGRAADRLDREVSGLRKGRRLLRRSLASADCERLPGNDPFQE